MKLKILLFILFISSPAYATLTVNNIPKVKTGGTTPAIQNSSLSDNGTTVSTSEPISVGGVTSTNLVSCPNIQTSAGGTMSCNNTTYLTGNQSITLTGDTTGSGTTSIATTTSKVNGASVPASILIAGTNSSSQIIQQFAKMNTNGINWNNFNFDLGNINWQDMKNLYSTTGINWANNIFNTGGINWDSWTNVGTAGINWNDEIFNNVKNVHFDSLYDNGTCTTAATIDPKNGKAQKITLTNGDACALTFTQPPAGTTSYITLEVIQSTTTSFNGTISGCRWAGGTVMTPTASSGAIDYMSVFLDGTNANCATVGQNFS